MRIDVHAPGPPDHGVVRHAGLVTDALVAAGQHVGPTRPDVTHVHVTDALFGPDIGAAATAFARWRAQVDGPVVATFHDLPSGAGARSDRRRAGYRVMARQVDGVVVSSRHEALLCADLDVTPTVVPLPLPPLPPAVVVPLPPSVGVLGFLYPGKGHAEALRLVADAGLAGTVSVVALGAVSPGHDELAIELRRCADRLGVDLQLTGALSEAELHGAALAVAVPFSHNPGVSASASLMTWLAAGRRPLVDHGAYARETAQRWPGSVLFDVTLEQALAEPALTRGTPPPAPDVAGGHLAAFALALS